MREKNKRERKQKLSEDYTKLSKLNNKEEKTRTRNSYRKRSFFMLCSLCETLLKQSIKMFFIWQQPEV